MPPKPKYTKDEIAVVALDIVKEQGISALTAREVAKRLGTTVSPIFTTFKNMDEVKWAARELAMKEYEEYIGDFRSYTPAFKRIGMMMVSYAIYQPEIFKLLFMQQNKKGLSFEDAMNIDGHLAKTCIDVVQEENDLSKEEAKLLFEQMWIYTFGIASLCAMKVCNFTEEEIANRLGIVFLSLITRIKSGNKPDVIGKPVKKQDQIKINDNGKKKQKKE